MVRSIISLDRQDIYKLAARLDDILDLADASSSRIDLYQPKEVMPEARELAGVILQSTKQVSELVGLLRNILSAILSGSEPEYGARFIAGCHHQWQAPSGQIRAREDF